MSRTGLLSTWAATAHATETNELRETFAPYPPPILRTLTLILKQKQEQISWCGLTQRFIFSDTESRITRA